MPHKAGRTHGLQPFASASQLLSCASGKNCYALPAALPNTFYPLLAEACLLTGWEECYQNPGIRN